MTKATIRGNLTSFAPDAKVVRATGLDYVLGETNSYSCHVSFKTPVPELSLMECGDRGHRVSVIRLVLLYGL
jgi:hypothetical protein